VDIGLTLGWNEDSCGRQQVSGLHQEHLDGLEDVVPERVAANDAIASGVVKRDAAL
jgi:hypothetical protein